ncbi:MAG TPA: hypothetical protein VFK49_03540, partial [Stellaceae bacterium]|nr:hypothetical protein [Stellaceae bacterium]
RIIVVSGAETGHESARALGAKAVLRKPVAPAEVLRAVRDVLAADPLGEHQPLPQGLGKRPAF